MGKWLAQARSSSRQRRRILRRTGRRRTQASRPAVRRVLGRPSGPVEPLGLGLRRRSVIPRARAHHLAADCRSAGQTVGRPNRAGGWALDGPARPVPALGEEVVLAKAGATGPDRNARVRSCARDRRERVCQGRGRWVRGRLRDPRTPVPDLGERRRDLIAGRGADRRARDRRCTRDAREGARLESGRGSLIHGPLHPVPALDERLANAIRH